MGTVLLLNRLRFTSDFVNVRRLPAFSVMAVATTVQRFHPVCPRNNFNIAEDIGGQIFANLRWAPSDRSVESPPSLDILWVAFFDISSLVSTSLLFRLDEGSD